MPRVSVIAGALFDPSAADAIARHGSYYSWIALRDDHVADLAVWPSATAARQALRRYRLGGPATRPDPGNPAFPHVLRHVGQIRNVTIAWYSTPTPAEAAAVSSALVFHRHAGRGGQYTRFWAIAGARIDTTTANAYWEESANFAADIDLVGGELEIAIWPTRRAATQSIAHMRQGLGLPEGDHLQQVNNATIEWKYQPTEAEEALIRDAFH